MGVAFKVLADVEPQNAPSGVAQLVERGGDAEVGAGEGHFAHALEHQGKPEAAKLVAEAVHYFGHCNDRLEEALRLVKGE